MTPDYSIATVLVIVITIGLFFLFRFITLWYFKINERVSNQEEIIRLLKKIAKEEAVSYKSTYEKKYLNKE